MTARNITPPYPVFLDREGNPLDNGFVFIGVENLEPLTNPLAIYWDEALTIPAANPVRTINGYPSRSGSPSELFADSDYSITVRDSKGLIIYTNLSQGSALSDLASTATGKGDALIGVSQGVATTQHELNGRIIYAMDKMTAAQKADVLAGTRTLAVHDAVQDAVDDLATTGGVVILPHYGNLRFDDTVTIPNDSGIKISGGTCYETGKGTRISWYGGSSKSVFKIGSYTELENLFIYNANSATGMVGINAKGTNTPDNAAHLRVVNVHTKSFATGFALDFSWNNKFESCIASYCTVGWDLNTECNAQTFVDCSTNLCGVGVSLKNGTGMHNITWSGGSIENSTTYGLEMGAAPANSVVFNNVYFEGNAKTCKLTGQVSLVNCYINSDGINAGTIPIEINASRGVSITNFYLGLLAGISPTKQIITFTGADGDYQGGSVFISSALHRINLAKSLYLEPKSVKLGWLDSKMFVKKETPLLTANVAHTAYFNLITDNSEIRDKYLFYAALIHENTITVGASFLVRLGYNSATYDNILNSNYVANITGVINDIPLVGSAPVIFNTNSRNFFFNNNNGGGAQVYKIALFFI